MLYYWLFVGSRISIDEFEDKLMRQFELEGYGTERKRLPDKSIQISVWKGSWLAGRGEIKIQIWGDQNQFWFMINEKGDGATYIEGGFIGVGRQKTLNETWRRIHPMIFEWTGAQCVNHYIM